MLESLHVFKPNTHEAGKIADFEVSIVQLNIHLRKVLTLAFNLAESTLGIIFLYVDYILKCQISIFTSQIKQNAFVFFLK